MSGPRYVHTNLVARDWLDESTGLSGARLRGMHLRLPGHGPDGPTLEVFSYDDLAEQGTPAANRLGFGHIAFHVDDVAATRRDGGGRRRG